MVICADTSFLFALYANDVHTPKALTWVRATRSAVSLSEFTDFEFGNALRFAEFSGRLGPGKAAVLQAHYDADRAAGRVRVEVCNLAEGIQEARRLSATHTLVQGHRGFDILHVATALRLRAEQFLTFDANQRKLARAEGLVVPL